VEHSIKETYRIQYVDNTFQLVDWTIDQLAIVYRDMDENKQITMIDRCIFRLSDIRAIVHIPLPEEEETILEDGEKEIIVTEMGVYEKELFDMLVQNGYDVGTVVIEGKGGK
jgi:hypothetical protein